MIFKLYKNGRHLPAMVRSIGYKPIGYTPQEELNCVRPLGGDYPRFHIYAKEKEEIIAFSIHLDQKKPSYGEETAHSGEYEGETLEDEVQRIKDILYKD